MQSKTNYLIGQYSGECFSLKSRQKKPLPETGNGFLKLYLLKRNVVLIRRK